MEVDASMGVNPSKEEKDFDGEDDHQDKDDLIDI
jgi:hypothetical protein